MRNVLLTAAVTSMISIGAYASDIKPIIGVELGSEAGSIDSDYSISGIGNGSYNEDYAGANFRLSAGIAIEHDNAESRIKFYTEGASGEIDYSGGGTQDIDSSEIGINYELLFGNDKFRPLVGIEVGTGNSEFKDSNVDVDYSSFGLYGGIAYEISDNLDFTARVGYKERNYDDYNYISYGYYITEDTDYSGVDVKVGLVYKF